jgi:alpha-L-arabinofuranosidase
MLITGADSRKNKKVMTSKILKLSSTVLLFLVIVTIVHGQSRKAIITKITVDVNKPVHKIPSSLFGIFFEDINHSTDGGIYPELVRNRSFEDADTLQNWKFTNQHGTSIASIKDANIYSDKPEPPLNVYNRKMLFIKADGAFKLENDGYWGMNIDQGSVYTFQVAAFCSNGFNSSLKISIVSSKGIELASGAINGIESKWKYYTANLSATGSDPSAHLEITSDGKGSLYMDMVSLMPLQTWKNHHLRIDLAEAVNALHPKFLRFPGGCWVEGDDFKHMFHWKNTIGNIDARTALWNIWGYNATQGMGYHEYLQMAEDMGAEPLFCISAGISHKEIVPMDQMGQWVQDALDAIEYANGTENSVWGSIRAKNGHPKPFNLKYMEIGNENGGDAYNERWALIAKAIQSKYPDIKLIANDWGGYPQDPIPLIKDEHYYNVPDWFIWNANKFDNYDRKGPKIFVGEYAVTGETGNGNLRGAIGEAAWMTGLERNSDVVEMAAYAPLLCNANHKAWPINLINFDSKRWYGLPSYYVQQLFAENMGTVSLPVNVEDAPVIKAPYSEGCIGLGTWSNSAEFKDLKVVSPNGKILYQADFTKDIADWRKTGGEWSVKDGVLRQSAIAPNTTAFVGDVSWTDYTITLKARKISGDNGIQIYFRNKNNDQRLRWEAGGSGNTAFMMDNGIYSKNVPGSIEANRWYDVKVEVNGSTVKAYLDGKLVQELSGDNTNTKALSVSAVKNEYSGDIILKVVNTSAAPLKTQVYLSGAGNLSGNGKAIVLTSSSPLDENTLDAPTKVLPQTETITFTGDKIIRSFQGNSLTVLRLEILPNKNN